MARKKNKPRLEAIRVQERVSMNEALAYRAGELHKQAPGGFDRAAAWLTARVHSSTCQPHPDGGWMLWVRVRLSDGSQYRLCWYWHEEFFLGGSETLWRRVPWSQGYSRRK